VVNQRVVSGPVIRPHDWGLVCILERCIEALIIWATHVSGIVKKILVVLVVLLLRVVTTLARVRSNRRQIRGGHFIFVDLRWCIIESHALRVAM
jgi:hypothetical protein